MKEFIVRRFWDRVNKGSSCWEWTGRRQREGYGTLGIRKAHRMSYELHIGPIPDGLEIDHLCRNRACVRPDHLEAVTHQENVLRGVGAPARLARRTHCINGHPFTPQSTWLSSAWKGRRCRICATMLRRRLCRRCRAKDHTRCGTPPNGEQCVCKHGAAPTGPGGS